MIDNIGHHHEVLPLNYPLGTYLIRRRLRPGGFMHTYLYIGSYELVCPKHDDAPLPGLSGYEVLRGTVDTY